MLISLGVTVIILDNFIEKWGESIVRIVRSGINTNTGVSPLGSREDSLLESEAKFIFLVLACSPDIWGKAFTEDGFGTGWEVWHTSDGLWSFKVGSHELTLSIMRSGLSWRSSNGGSILSTHSKEKYLKFKLYL
jgi:hypothetical protein